MKHKCRSLLCQTTTKLFLFSLRSINNYVDMPNSDVCCVERKSQNSTHDKLFLNIATDLQIKHVNVLYRLLQCKTLLPHGGFSGCNNLPNPK